ncbi:MAG TPA: SdpI family protein [Gemmatimonadaceae bacterium]|jgi:uncharacterized membrane protein|nr:SdpI family protein [Gemmatimonadaceae bacterium]
MRKWLPLLIVLAAIITSAVVYPHLPDRVPTHWNAAGQPNGYSARFWGAWLIPLFLIGMWAIMWILPAIDPRGANYAKFQPAFEAIIIALMLFLAALHIIALRAALGHPAHMERIVPLGVGILLVVIGNLLPRARPNWFVGIRTPWTLSSDRVWEKTHRLGGKLFVAGGLIIIIAGILVSQWAHIVLIVVMLAITLGVMVYSYLEWKRERPATRPNP